MNNVHFRYIVEEQVFEEFLPAFRKAKELLKEGCFPHYFIRREIVETDFMKIDSVCCEEDGEDWCWGW